MLVSAFRADFSYPAGAAAVVGQMLPAFFVDVGPRCNFACPFCSVPREPEFFPTAQIEGLIAEAGRCELGLGFFTGGEPSIHPELEQLMAHGGRHGVSLYGISTNGSGLTDPQRVRELERLGMRHWQLSFDDFRPEVLDRLRGHAGTLELLLRALDVLSGLDHACLSLNQVVCRDNLEQVPQMVEYVVGLRERFPRLAWLLVSLVKPVGSALENPELLFAHEQAAPVLYRAIDRAEQAGLALVLNNVPACLIPERVEYRCSSFEHLRLVDTATGESLPMRFPGYDLRKGPACLSCREFETCNGWWGAQEDRFGVQAYRPTGALVRDRPLPPAALERQRELARTLTARQLGSEAPQDRHRGVARAGSAEANDGEAGAELAREIDEHLGRGWPGGYALERSELRSTGGGTEYHAVLVGASGRLEVVIAPDVVARPAYRRTGRLAIWHAGTDLDPTREQVLQRVCTRAEQAEEMIARLLARGRAAPEPRRS